MAIRAGDEQSPSGKVFKAIKKPQGTLALIGEGVSMDTVSLGGYDLHDPQYLSGQYRDGGCALVAVRAHSYEDSLGENALALTVEEQEKARGEFPGPICFLS